MKFSFAVALLWSYGVFCQQKHALEPFSEERFHFIDPGYVRDFRIRSFHGYYSTKVSGDVIRPTFYACWFEFNSSGNLVNEYQSSYGDTTFHSYSYDSKSRLIAIRGSDRYGAELYLYSYDEKDRLVCTELRTSSQRPFNPFDFDLDTSHRQFMEFYHYTEFETTLTRKEFLNHCGKVYQEELLTTDARGRIIHTESYTLNGTARTSNEFKFDEFGRIISLRASFLNQVEIRQQTDFSYDMAGNLLSQKHYENGSYTTEMQVVFDSDNGLPDAIIWRDEESNYMTILNFSGFSFY